MTAKLSIDKKASANPVTAGDALTYTLTINNAGPDKATGVVVTDTLPAGVTFASANPAQDAGPNPLVWNVGDIDAGDSRTITIVVNVDTSTVGDITNTAEVSGNEQDPDDTDNKAAVTTQVYNPFAIDLQVSKTADESITAGKTLTYTIVVTNSSLTSNIATGVTVTDTLPAGVTIVSANPAQDAGPNPLVWNLSDIPAGSLERIQVVVEVNKDTAGDIVNTVVATADEPELDERSNQDSAKTTVVPSEHPMIFRGYVYEGPPGDFSMPLANVTIHLYGRNEGEPEPGSFHKIAQSSLDGFFNFHMIKPWIYDIFTLVAESPEGMVPIGIWSEDGKIINKQTVMWETPDFSVHENMFYFEEPTAPPSEPITKTIELPLMSDTWLRWSEPDRNQDMSKMLVIRPTGLDNALIVFDRTDLPQGATILDAKLTVNVVYQSGAEGKMLAALDTEVFTPKQVTYNNQPMIYNPGPSVVVPMTNGPLMLDVTNQVSAWDQPKFTSYHRGYLALSASGPNGRIVLESKETPGGKPPTLTVTYTVTP